MTLPIFKHFTANISPVLIFIARNTYPNVPAPIKSPCFHLIKFPHIISFSLLSSAYPIDITVVSILS